MNSFSLPIPPSSSMNPAPAIPLIVGSASKRYLAAGGSSELQFYFFVRSLRWNRA